MNTTPDKPLSAEERLKPFIGTVELASGEKFQVVAPMCAIKAMKWYAEEYAAQQVQTAVQRDKWISLKERAPEIGDRVMTYCHSQGIQICHRGYIGDEIGWLLSFDLTPAYLNITHWMPLPEPPKTI